MTILHNAKISDDGSTVSYEIKGQVFIHDLPDDAPVYLEMAPPAEVVTLTSEQLIAAGWTECGAIVDDGAVHFADTFNGNSMKWGADCQKIEFTASAKPGDIVAQIDKLVSEEKCPHCGRDWHTRAITRDLLAMYERGRTDPSYFVKKDTSPILCDGSTFIGPLRPAPPANLLILRYVLEVEMPVVWAELDN